MIADPQTCHVCGAPRPLYKLGLRGYCGKHRPGMRDEVALIARFIGRFGDKVTLEPVVPAEADETRQARDSGGNPKRQAPNDEVSKLR